MTSDVYTPSVFAFHILLLRISVTHSLTLFLLSAFIVSLLVSFVSRIITLMFALLVHFLLSFICGYTIQFLLCTIHNCALYTICRQISSFSIFLYSRHSVQRVHFSSFHAPLFFSVIHHVSTLRICFIVTL